MGWVLDSSEAIGKQHLNVPVAAEIAVALQLVNVLDAFVAEVGNLYRRVKGAEVCEYGYRARRFFDHNSVANELARWTDAAFVAWL